MVTADGSGTVAHVLCERQTVNCGDLRLTLCVETEQENTDQQKEKRLLEEDITFQLRTRGFSTLERYNKTWETKDMMTDSTLF